MRRSLLLLSVLSVMFTIAMAVQVIAAESVSTVNISDKQVELSATVGIDQVRYFTLDSPKRLVVDMYGVKPGEHAKKFPLTDGFSILRAGPLENKTRFVFDVTGAVFPIFNVETVEDRVVVTWNHAQDSVEHALAEPATSGSSKITAIDFASEGNRSQLQISVDGRTVVTEAIRKGNKVQFALKNTTLPRSLRREFDTLTFPSAIHSATPYLVNVAGKPEVRFVVLLKGNVPHQLSENASGLIFSVEDGAYAKAEMPLTGTLPVSVAGEVTTSAMSDSKAPIISRQQTISTLPVPVIESVNAEPNQYTGEKTSLVFDNADVRDILRLIAEISDLNIIASDAVKGNVTLRLIDVPWDQALDLILDVTGLGMVQEGNVVRVLPKDTIRSMKEAELTAVRSQEKLEPLSTEVVTVSYADLGSVAGPAKDLLSDRGSITEDSRNKLLIITDVPARIEKAKELISILDTPERQVMIEARVVQVNSNYSKDLGVNWGITYNDPNSEGLNAGTLIAGGVAPAAFPSIGTGGVGVGFTVGDSSTNTTILDLRLSALEAEGKGKVISTPRVTTLNGETATISQGTTIPYESTGSDGPKTEFVSAELKLEVTPVINPDDSIILEVLATNDSPSVTTGATAPSIDTKKAETKVLIRDGETTVIGGIFVETTSESDSGVPMLKNVPILGNLFKTQSDTVSKDELLIFITPRIVRSN